MEIKRKGSPNSQPKQKVVKINRYEMPEEVLKLVGQICSARPSDSINAYWDTMEKTLWDKQSIAFETIVEQWTENMCDEDKTELKNKFSKACSFEHFCRISRLMELTYNDDLFNDLKDKIKEIGYELQTPENTEHTQIVVAGGFSSGKSSFLNNLTEQKGLLPTGLEPVSVIKTYIYCSDKYKDVGVSGVNLKNAIIELDKDVLQAIQHSNKSKVYLTSTLEKLFVTIPSSKLDGLAFIDTPGYNNTDMKNVETGKSDKDVAIEGLDEGNVLFWLVDVDKGTLSADDLDMMDKAQGKPKVIIFNKADKKGEIESKEIVCEAAEMLYHHFSEEEIIDILAYSSLENKIYYSKNDYSMQDIIREVKKTGKGTSNIDHLRSEIESLFEDEIDFGKTKKKEWDEEYKNMAEISNNAYKSYRDDKTNNEEFLDDIREIMVDSYSEVGNGLLKYMDIAECAIDLINELKAESKTKELSHWSSDERFLARINGYYSSKCKQLEEKWSNNYSIVYELQSRGKDLRKRKYDAIKEELNALNEFRKNEVEYASEHKERCRTFSKEYQEYIDAMTFFKDLSNSKLDEAIKEYKKENKKSEIISAASTNINIFQAIEEGDYQSFERCFMQGVDLNKFNSEGYSPLTLAVREGNNNMVTYLLNKNADAFVNDGRGKNAFMTSVENQFRDICELLLEHDKDLINSKTANGESVIELAQENKFLEWIKEIM